MPARIPVSVIDGENNTISAETQDISVGGALLKTDVEIAREREYVLHFYLANVADNPVARKGRVAHVRDEKVIGVQFTDADLNAKRSIWQYMIFRATRKSND